MIGVILAGGRGTRLRPATNIYNKHLALVYDRPMIDYPIETLQDMGCDRIILVSGGEHIGGFAEYLKDGSDRGLDITYKVQPKAGGIAQALGCVAGLTSGLFPVILGDNYFHEPPKMPKKATLYTKAVPDPQRFGVYFEGKIEEKPTEPKSNQAVTGLYVYDDRVFEFLPVIKPSARGEYEISDINQIYLDLEADVIELNTFWSDMGTPDSLLWTADFIRSKG